MKKLENDLKKLHERKIKLQDLKKEIESKRADFEESLTPLKQSISAISQECDALEEEKISIAIVDLVYELARLTGIDVTNIGVTVHTDIIFKGKHTKEGVLSEMVKLQESLQRITPIDTSGMIMSICLFEKQCANTLNKAPRFEFNITVPFHALDIQKDGKTLFEHCNIKHGYDRLYGEPYTKIIVNKNIESILCIVKLRDLVKPNSFGFQPVGLLRKVVLNCKASEVKTKTMKN